MRRLIGNSAGRLAVSALLTLSATAAQACFICIELPEETLTDRVWAADAVVLARPAADNPFAFEPASILQGRPRGAIPFLVDSATRRQMAQRPDQHALVLQRPDGSWERGPTGGEALGKLVGQMLAQETAWSDAQDDPDRARAFLALHAHDDPAIRAIALQELAHLPYAQLRGIELALSVDWLLRSHADRGFYALRPLLVRLLGLHRDPAARELVRRRAFERPASDREDWLVALIEVDGAAGIGRVLGASAGRDAARAAVRALVTHAGASPELGPDIATGLHRLVADHPALAAEAVPGLAALGDYSLAPRVAELLAHRVLPDPAEAFALKSYLAQARASSFD